MAVIFHGTDKERDELLAAMSRNCECLFDGMGARTRTCGAHGALVDDQRMLDGLMFARRIRARLITEEGGRVADDR